MFSRKVFIDNSKQKKNVKDDKHIRLPMAVLLVFSAPRTPPRDLPLIYNTNRMLSSENSTEIYYNVTKLLLIKEIPGTAIYGAQSSFQVLKILRIRRSQKQRDRCWSPIGYTNIFFLANQRQAFKRVVEPKLSLKVAPQGLSHSFLKTFAAFYPDPTNRPWVSKDGLSVDLLL